MHVRYWGAHIARVLYSEFASTCKLNKPLTSPHSVFMLPPPSENSVQNHQSITRIVRIIRPIRIIRIIIIFRIIRIICVRIIRIIIMIIRSSITSTIIMIVITTLDHFSVQWVSAPCPCLIISLLFPCVHEAN